MAKFYGKVGFGETVETVPGQWDVQITERSYCGDVTKISKRNQQGESVNDNLILRNEFSIIADAYAYQNFLKMLYIEWMGVRWKISSVDVQRPRLLLSIGDVYNGNSGATPDPA